MRNVSKKTRARQKEGQLMRETYRLQHAKCQVCKKRPTSEVHHIAGRNLKAREEIYRKYESADNWLAVCRECHEIVDKQSPAKMACAAKLLDEKKLELAMLKSLKPGKRFAISVHELQEACDDLIAWRGGDPKNPKQKGY